MTKTFKTLALIILTLALLVSCDLRIDGHEDEDQDFSHLVISPTTTTTLKFEGGKTWYKCDDLDGTNPVQESTQGETLPVTFDSQGIKYYKCISDTSSKTFAVAYTGLPVVYINTKDGEGINSRETYKEATIKIVVDGLGSGEDVNEAALSVTEVLVKGRGNSSWMYYPKKSINLKFDEKQKLLGMKNDKRWALIANYNDNCNLGNWYASFLARKVVDRDEWNAEVVMVDVVINDQYYGNMALSETVKIGSKRIDIQDISEIVETNAATYDLDNDGEADIEDVTGDGKIDINDGGFVLEAAFTRDSTANFATHHGASFGVKDPDLEEATGSYSFKEMYYHIKKITQKVEDAIYDTSSTNYLNLFDLDSFVDWYIVNESVGNWENGFVTSTFMYYNPEDGKMYMSSVWDCDRTLTNESGVQTNTESSLWVHQLLSRKEVQEAIQTRWAAVKKNYTKSLSSLKVKIKNATTDKKIDVNMGFEIEYNKCLTSFTFEKLRWPNKSLATVEAKKATIANRFEWFDTYVNELGK